MPDDRSVFHVIHYRNPQTLISRDGSRGTNRSKPWPETPFSRKVLVFLSPARRKRDVGAAVANGDRSEVDRARKRAASRKRAQNLGYRTNRWRLITRKRPT